MLLRLGLNNRRFSTSQGRSSKRQSRRQTALGFSVHRLEDRTLLNGSFDTSFGSAELPGRALIPAPGLISGEGLAIQRDGKIVVVGSVANPTSRIAIARFNDD